MEEKFILVKLNEQKSKDIATVMSNKTARKILELLTDKEKVSPSEISKKLNIPINTIMHALKLLEKESFIIRADHAWSEKGKKVFLYSLAKKMILIIPKDYDWKESLKKILPIALFGAAISLAIRIYSSQQTTESVESSLVFDAFASETTKEATTTAWALPGHAFLYPLTITLILIAIIFIYDLWRQKK